MSYIFIVLNKQYIHETPFKVKTRYKYQISSWNTQLVPPALLLKAMAKKNTFHTTFTQNDLIKSQDLLAS